MPMFYLLLLWTISATSSPLSKTFWHETTSILPPPPHPTGDSNSAESVLNTKLLKSTLSSSILYLKTLHRALLCHLLKWHQHLKMGKYIQAYKYGQANKYDSNQWTPNLIPAIYGSHRWLYKQNFDRYQLRVSFSPYLPLYHMHQ